MRRGAGLLAALLVLGLVACPAPPARADELDYGLEAHRLRGIVLAGNASFSDSELKSVLQLREPSWLHPLSVPVYRPDLLEAQIRLLIRYYRQRGFHQVTAAVDSIVAGSDGDVIHIALREGPRTYLERIVFAGHEPLTEDDLKGRLLHREGDPAPADLVDFGRDLYNLRSLYWERAYLDVRIEPELLTAQTERPGRRAATLRYLIEPGRAYTVSQVEVAGNERTRRQLIERELRLRQGEPFRWDAVDRSRRELLDTALFRDVNLQPAGLDTAAGTAGLRVEVVERRPAYYELGAGIGSRERVRLLGAWGHNNLWGSGRRLLARGKLYWTVEQIAGSDPDGGAGGFDPESSPELNYRADLLYVNPHLRGSGFRLETDVYAEKETRGESGLNLHTLGFGLGTRFRTGPKTLHTLALQFEQSDPRLHPDVQDSALQEGFRQANIRRTQTRSAVLSMFHEGRDDPFRPRRGSITSSQVELAGGPVFGGDNSFVRGVVSWHGYAGSPLGGVIAVRTSVGAARPYAGSARRGADGVPYSKRFFAGGVNSVRGYLENSLGPQITDPALRDRIQFASDMPLPANPARGGNYLLLTNAEWRFPLPLLRKLRLGGVFFLDGGNVWEHADDLRLRAFRLRSHPGEPPVEGQAPLPDDRATKVWDYRWSMGTGLRLETPFGPFRFDVGWPLKRALGEDKVMYHFSLGYPF